MMTTLAAGEACGSCWAGQHAPHACAWPLRTLRMSPRRMCSDPPVAALCRKRRVRPHFILNRERQRPIPVSDYFERNAQHWRPASSTFDCAWLRVTKPTGWPTVSTGEGAAVGGRRGCNIWPCSAPAGWPQAPRGAHSPRRELRPLETLLPTNAAGPVWLPLPLPACGRKRPHPIDASQSPLSGHLRCGAPCRMMPSWRARRRRSWAPRWWRLPRTASSTSRCRPKCTESGHPVTNSLPLAAGNTLIPSRQRMSRRRERKVSTVTL